MKIKIRLAILGHLPKSEKIEDLKSWSSELFQITSVGRYNIAANADGLDWEYSDKIMEDQIPPRDDEDVLVSITNVPIEGNYYSRRYQANRVCLSYSGMREILDYNNIPIENLLLRVMYSMSFVYKRYGNRIPLMTELANYTHDDTRGCIFDMNGIRTDIVYSTYKPQLCAQCIQTLTSNKVAATRVDITLIDKVQKELRKIDKGLYYKIADLVKLYPIWALIISTISALVLGTAGSLIASLIYAKMTRS